VRGSLGMRIAMGSCFPFVKVPLPLMDSTFDDATVGFVNDEGSDFIFPL
jgi:hypothetical protein